MRLRRKFSILAMLVLLPLFALAIIAWRHVERGDSELAEDCEWSGEAQVWLDNNRNGIWDKGEEPFQGVKIVVDDALNHYTNVGRDSVSDSRGQASLGVWLPGCPNVEFEIYAKPPAGYRLTTQPRVSAHGRTVFEFGLIKSE